MDEKVTFVSGHYGTTLSENLLLVSMMPLSYLTWHIIRDIIISTVLKGSKCLLIESILLSLTMLFTFTIWQRHVLCVNITFILFNVAAITCKYLSNRTTTTYQTIVIAWNKIGEKMYTHERRFIGAFKSFILITSAVCILAVDFVIFPRRFAKTEEFGAGFMDSGVGMFIVANGIVSSYARYDHDHHDSYKVFRKNFISSLPLLVLGMMRTIIITFSGYHIHITEYGVHWNFFLTLVAVKILSSLLFMITPYRLAAYIGVVIIGIYQVMLSQTSLQLYILSDGPRDSLFTANKEGVISLLGYIGLYMISVGLGQYLFQPRDRYKEWVSVLTRLLLLGMLIIVSVPILESWTGLCSRRLGNLPYCSFIVGVSCALLSAFLAVELLVAFMGELGWSENRSESKSHVLITDTPQLVVLIKQNALFYFIIANLLTGAVNISIRTVTVADNLALTILIGYVFTTNFIIYVLSAYSIHTKFW